MGVRFYLEWILFNINHGELSIWLPYQYSYSSKSSHLLISHHWKSLQCIQSHLFQGSSIFFIISLTNTKIYLFIILHYIALTLTLTLT